MAHNNGKSKDVNELSEKQQVFELLRQTAAVSAWYITDLTVLGYTAEQMDVQIFGIEGFSNVFQAHRIPLLGQQEFSVLYGEGWTFNYKRKKAYCNPVVIVEGESIRDYGQQLAILKKIQETVTQRRKALPESQPA